MHCALISSWSHGLVIGVLVVGGLFGPVWAQTAAAPAAAGATEPATTTGPLRLRASPARVLPSQAPLQDLVPALPREPDEFERFASGLAGHTPAGKPAEIRRFGSDLIDAVAMSDDAENSSLVPADYLVKPGDQVTVALWGSVDAELTLVVDRSGRITLPRVGTVAVAGVRYGDLPDLLRRRVGQVFKNFELSVSMGQLRGLRVFVTGFARRPGAYAMTSLSTLSLALFKAGGPSAAGTFRRINLRRQGKLLVSYDLYELLAKGDRSGDLVLEADDVVHVGPAGVQVALIGSVNLPAVFELKSGETVSDLLQLAGGFSPVADRSRLTVERLDERDKLRIIEWPLPVSESRTLAQGDVLRAFSAVASPTSQLRHNKRVRVEGEVAQAGTYILPPNSTVDDAVRAAGGLTTAAYLFGTELQRESVRIAQQENYDRALRDMETEFARSAANQRVAGADDLASQTARTASTTRLIDRLRALRPSGRVVLELTPNSTQLPELVLEDGDRVYIPPLQSTVGVFGSVFSVGSYLYGEQRTLGDYLRLAGGPTRGADGGSTFVIRANGSVISARQGSSWFGGSSLAGLQARPGDTIFVPEETDKSSFIQNVKDWTQILYQFGLGVAAFKTLSN